MSSEMMVEIALNVREIDLRPQIPHNKKGGRHEETLALDARVKELRSGDRNLSCKEITQELNITNNQLIGSLHRLISAGEIETKKMGRPKNSKNKMYPTNPLKLALVDFLSGDDDETMSISDLKLFLRGTNRYKHISNKNIELALDELRAEGSKFNVKSDSEIKKEESENKLRLKFIVEQVESMLMEGIFSAYEMRKRLNFSNDGVIPISSAINKAVNKLYLRSRNEFNEVVRTQAEIAKANSIIIDLVYRKVSKETIQKVAGVSPARFATSIVSLIKNGRIKAESTIYLYNQPVRKGELPSPPPSH